jgi:hypothetical protein
MENVDLVKEFRGSLAILSVGGSKPLNELCPGWLSRLGEALELSKGRATDVAVGKVQPSIDMHWLEIGKEDFTHAN